MKERCINLQSYSTLALEKATSLNNALYLLDYDPTMEDFFAKYYVERADVRSNIDKIKQVILDQKSIRTKILFTGYSGGGKTVELYRLKKDLEEKEDFYVIVISSVRDLDPDLNYTDILLLLIKKSLQLIEDKSIILDNTTIQRVGELLKQFIGDEIATTKLTISTLIDGFAEIVGINSSDSIRRKALELKGNIKIIFNEILSSIEKNIHGKKTFFIIEDLEKLIRDQERFKNLLLELSINIQSLNCRMAISVPYFIFYWSELHNVEHIYHQEYFLPIFQVRNKDGTENENDINLMKDIVRKRIPESIIPNNVVKHAALISGGVVYSFLELLRDCCAKAIADNLPSVSMNMLNASTTELVNRALIITDEKYINKLNEVRMNKGDKVSIDETFKDLLYQQAILEYRDNSGNRWYDIHPFLSNLEDKNLNFF